MTSHIRFRLLLLMLPIILLTLLFAYRVSVGTGSQIVNELAEAKTFAEQTSQTAHLERLLDTAGGLAEGIAGVIGQSYGDLTIDTLVASLYDTMEHQDRILGMGVWFAPNVFDKERRFVGPYVHWKKGSLVCTTDYESPSYNYLEQPYYLRAKQAGTTIFTSAYYDEHLGMYLITCASPIYNSKKEFIGCTTADIELASMQEIVRDYNRTHESEVYIVDARGVFLAFDDTQAIAKGQQITEHGSDAFRNAMTVVLTSYTGVTSYTDRGVENKLFYYTMNPLGWKIIYEIPSQEIRRPLEQLGRTFFLIVLAALLLISAILLVFSTRVIIRPLEALEKEFLLFDEQMESADIPATLQNRRDEFRRIGLSLQTMKGRFIAFREEITQSMEELAASEEEIRQQNLQLTRQEKQLVEGSLYITSIIGAMPDMIFIVSDEGVFLDCRGDMTQLYLPPEAFLGKRIEEVLPSGIHETALRNIRIVLETGTSRTMEYSLPIPGRAREGHYELRITRFTEDKVVCLARDITREHERTEEIEYLGWHDQVTGLYNRRFFEKVMDELGKGPGETVCLVIADVNGLKIVNDSFGHEAGDQLLQRLAGILTACSAEGDIVCRTGGDEFVILMAHDAAQRGDAFIRSVEAACSENQVYGITLSVSFGMGVARSGEASLREVLRAAEDRMYQNKLFDSFSRQRRMIDVIVKVLQEKNPREEQHSHRVAALCEKLAERMGMEPTRVQRIKSAALLHDIGKIGIPEHLLNKPGKLTEEEYRMICKHPEIGYRILQSAGHLSDISEIILFHHERWDGSGYPRGIAGDEIPVESRIIAVADSLDAMISDRSYRRSMTVDAAMAELSAHAGTQFDAAIVALLRDAVEDDDFKHMLV